MITKICATVAVAFALVTGAGPAQAAPTGPGTAIVEKANKTIAGLLKKKVKAGSQGEKELVAKVTVQVRDLLDIDELGKAALATHWAAATPAQQTEYLALLRALIEAEYLKGLRSNVSYTVSYEGETAGTVAGEVIVSTKIKAKRKGRPFTIGIDYVLRPHGGTLRAYDVKTDGVGMVENYRAQFAKIIAKSGMDGLLAKMRKKKGS